jgi:hypothetical protein
MPPHAGIHSAPKYPTAAGYFHVLGRAITFFASDGTYSVRGRIYGDSFLDAAWYDQRKQFPVTDD